MNSLTLDLERLCREAQTTSEAIGHGPFAQRIHLMPQVGWLNDPNGLCWRDGVYHAYYQNSPFAATGGLKFWAHATSRDLVDWEHDGVVLYPDSPADFHGVYSGSAVVEGGLIHAFYTGNVKLEDEEREFDYVTEGRLSSTVLTSSADGSHFGFKKVVLSPEDYPADVTCHVRDPKVVENPHHGPGHHRWLMMLGARRAGETRDEDMGEVLVYGSDDLHGWELVCRIAPRERFGYMWECPDLFTLPVEGAEGETATLLSVSPQGLEGPEWEGHNIYQSGFFEIDGPLEGTCPPGEFKLWDAGFDFYAPQSLLDGSGRRVMIGWMGMPDTPEHVNKTLDHGWQHCFTLPREVAVEQVGEGRRVVQRPVAEIAARRSGRLSAEGSMGLVGRPVFDLEVSGIADSECLVRLAGGLEFFFDREAGELVLRFTDGSREGIGGGRGERRLAAPGLTDLRVVGDVSSAEFFANGGEFVFSTRYYPEEHTVEVEAPGAAIDCWELV